MRLKVRSGVRANDVLVIAARACVRPVGLAVMFAVALVTAKPVPAAARPVTLVVLGDSLVAGYGLQSSQAFPQKLGEALRAQGRAVKVINAGVSGDTSADGLARLDWSVPQGTDAAIVELGANDALRGLDPAATRTNLDAIVTHLQARGVTVLLAGMLAPPNMGPDYEKAFNAIYGELAKKHGVLLYPFFLDGVAAQPALDQADGMHPNAAGVEIIVSRFLPMAGQLLDRVAKKGGEK